MGQTSVNLSGVWTPLKQIWFKSGGTWTNTKSAWYKVNGNWVQVFATNPPVVTFANTTAGGPVSGSGNAIYHTGESSVRNPHGANFFSFQYNSTVTGTTPPYTYAWSLTAPYPSTGSLASYYWEDTGEPYSTLANPILVAEFPATYYGQETGIVVQCTVTDALGHASATAQQGFLILWP